MLCDNPPPVLSLLCCLAWLILFHWWPLDLILYILLYARQVPNRCTHYFTSCEHGEKNKYAYLDQENCPETRRS